MSQAAVDPKVFAAEYIENLDADFELMKRNKNYKRIVEIAKTVRKKFEEKYPAEGGRVSNRTREEMAARKNFKNRRTAAAAKLESKVHSAGLAQGYYDLNHQLHKKDSDNREDEPDEGTSYQDIRAKIDDVDRRGDNIRVEGMPVINSDEDE